MRLLVCGSRHWFDPAPVIRELDALRPAVVIEGGAQGADRIAHVWARRCGVELLTFPADWNRYGNRAGPIRNARMLRESHPDRGLAFGPLWKRGPWRTHPIQSNPVHTGTGGMVALLLAARIPTRWVAAPGAFAVELAGAASFPPPPGGAS